MRFAPIRVSENWATAGFCGVYQMMGWKSTGANIQNDGDVVTTDM
jgi:hypothetical protein